MSFSIRLGNFLYNRAFFAYQPLYTLFKQRQDRQEIELLTKLVKPGSVVADIGANIGFYAQVLAKLCGTTGGVHCFEPDSENFRHLETATGKLENVVINHKAVAANSGKLKIYLSKELNVDHRTYEPEEYDSTAEIDAIALDDYFEPGTRVDVIKMDIQGFEMQAIQGMKRVLSENPGIVIVSEYWPYGLRKAGSSATAYYRHLNELGMKVQILRHGSLQPLGAGDLAKMEPLGKEHYFNIIASRKGV
jgi:FkbM family methyltransferase